MTDTATTTCADPNDPLAEWAAKSAARMDELASVAMDMARSLGRLAEAVGDQTPVDAAPKPEVRQAAEGLMKTFVKVARCVRQCVWLQGRILKDHLARRDARDAETQAKADRAAVDLDHRRRRGGARRALAMTMAVDAIESTRPDRIEYERLMDALHTLPECLHPEDADFAERQVDDMALAFCKAIGVDPGRDWWSDAWKVEIAEGYQPPEPKSPP